MNIFATGPVDEAARRNEGVDGGLDRYMDSDGGVAGKNEGESLFPFFFQVRSVRGRRLMSNSPIPGPEISREVAGRRAAFFFLVGWFEKPFPASFKKDLMILHICSGPGNSPETCTQKLQS